MTVIKIRLSNKDAVMRRLRRNAQLFPTVIKQILTDVGNDLIIPAIQLQLIANRSVATGKLVSSFSVGFSLDAKSRIIVGVTSDQDYALEVEKGQGPHEPDMDVLEEYVQAKMGVSGQDIHSRAASIAATLRERGAKAHPYIAPAIDAIEHIVAVKVVQDLKEKFFP